MAWNNGNGNGQQQRKIPDLGKGWLRKTKDIKRNQEGKQLSPDFNGLVNFEGQILDVAIWYYAPRAGQNGQMMPESFSVSARRHDPNQRGQAPQQPMQQQMQYSPQQGYAPANGGQYAPPSNGAQVGPQYQQGPPQQYPPQQGGYAPAPGFQPQGQPPQQAPRWGGQPGAQAQPATMQGQGGYKPSDVPF